MSITVAVVGRPRHAGVAEAVREYETRAARYWPLAVREVREESARSTSPALVVEREWLRLAGQLPAGARVVLCDPGGDAMDSAQFAGWLQRQRDAAESVAFVIGGAFGLPEAARRLAARRLSLAPWTLPHELARLVLAEQLYRAGTIARGEPYHK
jgi:23S rRNA (pseudouridine1915-N3)-methyltransferase